jgi:hypothetical protein
MKAQWKYLTKRKQFSNNIYHLHYFVACIVSFASLSCDDNGHSMSGIPMYFVEISVIDSASNERLAGVGVAEMTAETSLNQILQGDSIRPFDQSFAYYYVYGYTKSAIQLTFVFRDNNPHTPDYSKYVAYKYGYKVWNWSKRRDTIFKLDKSGDDSLCIRLVRK